MVNIHYNILSFKLGVHGLHKYGTHLENSHSVFKKNSILPSQNLLYHLYHTILQHTQHPNFYFLIQLIKIIYTTQ